MYSVWIMIGAIVISVLVVMKISNTKQELVMKLVLILFVFVMITSGSVYVRSNASFGSPDGVIDFAKAYLAWFSNAFSNVNEVSGYIGKQDWKAKVPENKTN